MTDIDKLIRINLELEGLLKILRDRDSLEARDMLSEKVEEYTSALNAFLAATPAETPAAVSEAVEQGETLLAGAHAVEVKDQEAVEPEDEPEAEAAEAAVAREERHSGEPNARLLKAFTLNDRFRFRRELFGGDDADFSETLKLLADMDSYSEACDYLYNDMMWDRGDTNVADFMAILAANMPQ